MESSNTTYTKHFYPVVEQLHFIIVHMLNHWHLLAYKVKMYQINSFLKQLLTRKIDMELAHKLPQRGRCRFSQGINRCASGEKKGAANACSLIIHELITIKFA